MKPIEEQKAERALKVAELITEQAILFARYLNPDTPEFEKQKAALRLLIIIEMELPMILSTPLQRKEYPKGGFTLVGEKGCEMIIPKKPLNN